MEQTHTQRGMTLIEVAVGVTILLVVFWGFYSLISSLRDLAMRNKLHSVALMLANEQVETIRALAYDTIGTVAGLPAGNIPQNETITYDGVSYTRRTFIQYVDDPADGLGNADTLAADYKRIKVELSYTYHGTTQRFSLTTSIAPRSQESLAGAGILRLNVTNAENEPLGGATVHILNTTVATSVDITTYTNASGTVSFPGAWAGTGYEVTVSKSGYSSAQTYKATTTNPSPSPSPLTVAENSTTEMYFKIDLLSHINVVTRAWPVRSVWTDSYDDASRTSATSGVSITEGSLQLAGSVGTYTSTGTSTTSTIAPSPLDTWLFLETDGSVPAGTSICHRVTYDTGGGTFAAIPDDILPGNAAGLCATTIDLSSLATSTYSSLRIVTTLRTTNALTTPRVDALTLSYREPALVTPNVNFSLRGSKTIGTDASGNQIYKFSQSYLTNSAGLWRSGDLEWDVYELTPSGVSIADSCPILPITLDPNTEYMQTIVTTPSSSHALKVQVLDPYSVTIPNTEVRVQGSGVDTTRTASACGTAYFPLSSAATYTVSARAAGYATTSVTTAVSGVTNTTITLAP